MAKCCFFFVRGFSSSSGPLSTKILLVSRWKDLRLLWCIRTWGCILGINLRFKVEGLGNSGRAPVSLMQKESRQVSKYVHHSEH